MKPKSLLVAAGLLAALAGCTTTKASRAPVKPEAHFTIAHFKLSQVDVRPEVASAAAFDSPLDSSGDPVAGYATVQFIVDQDGMPREVQCVEASNAEFARAAAATVTNSSFRPGQKGGEAVATMAEERFRVGYGAHAINIRVGNDPDLNWLNSSVSGSYTPQGSWR